MHLQSGETLRALMKQRGFSMARMGRYAGVSQSFIHRLCTGEKRSCKPRTAEHIAEALDVPVSLLFVLKESPTRGRNVHGSSTRKGSAA
ncbi:MAG: XRE family transcriptional regulator [Desulfurellales bacterium]|nr:MAG: XRE family transcriptional regulator [Desulfurellales bacterium]